MLFVMPTVAFDTTVQSLLEEERNLLAAEANEFAIFTRCVEQIIVMRPQASIRIIAESTEAR